MMIMIILIIDWSANYFFQLTDWFICVCVIKLFFKSKQTNSPKPKDIQQTELNWTQQLIPECAIIVL